MDLPDHVLPALAGLARPRDIDGNSGTSCSLCLWGCPTVFFSPVAWWQCSPCPVAEFVA